MFHYKESDLHSYKFRGTPKENAVEWIDRFKTIGRHNLWPNNDIARAIDVSLEGAAYNWIVGLEARNASPDHWENQPDMTEEVRVNHLFRGLNPTLYARLYVLGIKSCEEFLEEARLHANDVKTAYERGYEGASREHGKPEVGAVGLDKVQELQHQIQEPGDELARARKPSRKKQYERSSEESENNGARDDSEKECGSCEGFEPCSGEQRHKHATQTVKETAGEEGTVLGLTLIDCSKTDAVVHLMKVNYADHREERCNWGDEVPVGKPREPAMFEKCVASTLAAQHQNNLTELMMVFHDVFAECSDCLVQYNVLELAIPTGEAALIKQLSRGGHGRSGS
ncbi:hypothetical protein OUZ56_011882 [Daphnia magna]|uniref:Retrotransposon gag domain-containing protein n=1 Tax=Daphnia magna TaxID=35525 RepID=A0ABQ9Z1E2_9CRUS|nr:hypothetical protein OUZ56_011882 [Daphnia magna]